jgi:hypothetical protein
MKQFLLVVVTSLLFGIAAHAQSPGIIVRPGGGAGVSPLNPNGDGFSSATTGGFTTSDITQSEIQYKIIPPPFLEPVADLLRGPSTLYSDLVRQVDGSGFYVFNDGTNLLFRLRLGSIVAGSKGYSILIDTDSKFSNSGASADPNYQAATTGVNGNPGFELEIVLETNFRVAIYNVDGTSSPVFISSYPVSTHSQISVALSTVSNTADYFYDFYVPISATGITAATPLRMTATTVMAPTAAMGGPKSDIYGVDDAATNNPLKSWEDAIKNQPTFTTTTITSGGSGPGAVCTAAPVVTGPLQAGAGITINGTWTRLDADKPSTAKIYLYKNGLLADSSNATSGSGWSISNVTLSDGDVIYTQAQASGESKCLQSNSIKVVGCTAANTSSTTSFSITCSGSKGFEGSRASGVSVKIYQVSSTGITVFGDDNTTTYRVVYPTATTWRFDSQFGNGNPSACSGGSNDVPDGSYMFTQTESGKCESAGVNFCITSAATATPVITQTNLYSGATGLSGTAVAGATVRFYRNDKLEATTTATGGNYSFTGLAMATGDAISVIAQTAGSCISAAATRTVTCFTTPPVINTDNNGNISTASATISGRSYEPAGAIVTILENSILIGTATVQSNGSWSLTYTPIASRSYTATQVNGSCAASAASAAAIALAATTVCPVISGAYNSAAWTISGTLASSFTGTVRLYLDGINIGFVSVTAATAWSINVNTTYSNTLYPGGVLTCSAQATGGAEKTDCVSSVTISCSAPATPSINPSSVTISVGQLTTFSVTNSISGIIYSITDVPVGTTNYATSKFGTNGSLSMPTYTFNSTGTYNVLVKAISLDGPGCLNSSAASITVNASTLPVTLVNFNGQVVNGNAELKWATSSEQNTDHFSVERSDDGVHFNAIDRVAAAGNSNTTLQYAYTDQQAIANIAWYRLQMVDKDGKYTTSQVLRLTNTVSKGLVVLSVLPNPFENDLQLLIQSDKTQSISVQLVDITGREVFRSNRLVNAGNNNLIISSLSHLSKGLYVLRVTNNKEELFTKRVNKVR